MNFNKKINNLKKPNEILIKKSEQYLIIKNQNVLLCHRINSLETVFMEIYR